MRVSGFWRTGLVVAVVFAAVWLCAIVYWRASAVAPGGMQLLLYLGVLPVAILSMLWIGARLRGRAEAGSAVALAADEAPAEPSEAVSRQSPAGILATAVNLACGADAGLLSRHLAALPRARLHPGLRDRDGLPVLAAFVGELDVESVRGQLERFAAGAGGPRFVDEHLRALALLEPVAGDLFDAAARLLPPLPEVEERVVAGLRRRIESAPVESAGVRILALLPQDMPQPLRAVCAEWLRELAHDSGLDPRRTRLDVASVQGQDEVWRRLERLIAAGPDAGADGNDWWLLLAAASSVGDRAVHALQAAGNLFRAGNAEGLVPGEGAAGLLLRPAGAASPAGEVAVPVLAAVRRGASEAGAPPRVAARATGELLTGLLTFADVSRDEVALVLSDADQRPSRVAEAAVAASAACPELDTASQCPALGAGSGHLGHVAPLALLALAAEQVRATKAPAVALSVAGARDRLAAAVRMPAALDTREPARHDAGQTPDLAA